MTELENLMFLSLGTLLNTYFSPWSLPNLSEAQTFSPANANMVLNFLKSERHILVWKAFTVSVISSVIIHLKDYHFKCSQFSPAFRPEDSQMIGAEDH